MVNLILCVAFGILCYAILNRTSEQDFEAFELMWKLRCGRVSPYEGESKDNYYKRTEQMAKRIVQRGYKEVYSNEDHKWVMVDKETGEALL